MVNITVTWPSFLTLPSGYQFPTAFWAPILLWLCASVLYGYSLRWPSKKTVALPSDAVSETLLQGSKQTLNDKTPEPPDWASLDFADTQPISTSFNWESTDEVPYRPWHDGPHHVTMGIQKTNLDYWVEIDKNYLSRYQYKRRLFKQYPVDTVQYLPGSWEPAYEALSYLVDFLPRRYPSMFTKTDAGIKNLVTGDNWDVREESEVWRSHHPLQVMGLLSTEDWFIMQTDDDGETTRLKAGANCFPAGWRLRERIGHSLWQIHAGKVPMYEQKLSKSMDRFFLRLRADKPYMRFNYAIDNDPELFHIHSHHNLTTESSSHPLTLDELFLRVERQFLQRLPRSRAIAFSIRTYVTPIRMVTKDKAIAKALKTSVGSYSPQVSAYKNKPLWGDILAAHLEELLEVEGNEKE